MADVQLRNVTKRYDETVAVRDLSLEVKDREFVVFLGPSGCGKTTTLRSIAGLEHPEHGEIFIDGQRVNHLTPAERDIAFVFQFYALYPHMTVYDNLAFPLKAVRASKEVIEQRIREVAAVLHIEPLLKRRPGKLSGGEMQRVAIGRAMVRRPKVFLMDEPLTNLDAKLRGEMRAELKRLQNDLGATTIYVTHDQLEAMSMGDRIAVMNGGLLQQMGSPAEVYNHPKNLFVAGFIGSPAMNFCPCRLTDDGASLLLGAGGNVLRLTEATRKRLAERLTNNQQPATNSALSLVLGVRPEDIHVSREELAEGMPAEVYVLEPLGSENIIDLRLAGSGAGRSERLLMKARTAPTFTPRMGDPLWARIDQERMHLFDAETTEAIF
jgi:multiple sugar transport system ATP-binding protein